MHWPGALGRALPHSTRTSTRLHSLLHASAHTHLRRDTTSSASIRMRAALVLSLMDIPAIMAAGSAPPASTTHSAIAVYSELSHPTQPPHGGKGQRCLRAQRTAQRHCCVQRAQPPLPCASGLDTCSHLPSPACCTAALGLPCTSSTAGMQAALRSTQRVQAGMPAALRSTQRVQAGMPAALRSTQRVQASGSTCVCVCACMHTYE